MTSHENNTELTVIIDFKIYAYLFKPIVDEMLERCIRVHLFFPKQMRETIESHFSDSPFLEYHYLDGIKKKHRSRFIIHRIAGPLFTRADFSFRFAKMRNQVNYKSKGFHRLLVKISHFTPKVSNSKINGFLHRLAGLGLKNPFPTQKILVGSLNASAELLGASGLQVYTIMESWDHAVKTPNGYRSEHVFVWNKELGNDWETCQGDRQWSVFYPLKLRYAIENATKHSPSSEHHGKDQKRTCVYAVASTDKFSGSLVVDIERRIINDLCLATKSAGWNLLIKARPNGRSGEFDQFINRYNHVEVTSVLSNDADVAANYIYTDDLNHIRFDEISHATLIINAFTTFGLDAAVAGYPVLQIDLRNSPEYEDSKQLYGNNHIKKYLLTRENIFTVSKNSLTTAIEEFLRASDLTLAEGFSEELRQWLIPDVSSQEAIYKLLDRILEN